MELDYYLRQNTTKIPTILNEIKIGNMVQSQADIQQDMKSENVLFYWTIEEGTGYYGIDTSQ